MRELKLLLQPLHSPLDFFVGERKYFGVFAHDSPDFGLIESVVRLQEGTELLHIILGPSEEDAAFAHVKDLLYFPKAEAEVLKGHQGGGELLSGRPPRNESFLSLLEGLVEG